MVGYLGVGLASGAARGVVIPSAAAPAAAPAAAAAPTSACRCHRPLAAACRPAACQYPACPQGRCSRTCRSAKPSILEVWYFRVRACKRIDCSASWECGDSSAPRVHGVGGQRRSGDGTCCTSCRRLPRSPAPWGAAQWQPLVRQASLGIATPPALHPKQNKPASSSKHASYGSGSQQKRHAW